VISPSTCHTSATAPPFDAAEFLVQYAVLCDRSSGPAVRYFSCLAVRWATQLALSVDAEILAVNAYQHPYAEVSPEDHKRQMEERSALLTEEWRSAVRDAGVSVRTEVHQGDPRDVLPITKDDGADLLVLGRTGEGGGPGFLHLGSVVEYVAHHSQIPLAVIPSYVPDLLNRVVLGVDSSVESSAAINWCADHLASTNADVLAVTVEAPYPVRTPASDARSSRGDLEETMNHWVAPISATGIAVLPAVIRDLHPADGLIGVASARRGDLLVIGTRGVGGFSLLRLGGVAMKVLHRASIPLVLVPPAT